MKKEPCPPAVIDCRYGQHFHSAITVEVWNCDMRQLAFCRTDSRYEVGVLEDMNLLGGTAREQMSKIQAAGQEVSTKHLATSY